MINVISAILIAFLYSVVCTMAGPMAAAQNFSFTQIPVVPFLLCFLVCTVANLLFFSVIPRIPFLKKDGRIFSYPAVTDKPFFFLIVWAFIFLSWMPAWLHFFPGILSYDAISQTGSALGTITDNHHPVLHTWLIRVFMNLGKTLFSSYEAGIAVMSLLQMLILSYALTRLAFLMKKKNVPMLLTALTILCSALWFMNACLSVTMVKDTLHAAYLILFTCHFTEISTDPAQWLKHRQNLVCLPAVSFLMCAFRNNGIYIYAFCFLILAIVRLPLIKKVRKYTLLILAIILPVILFKLYSGPVFSALNIAPGQVREALCIPIQQLQRVAVLHEEELTADQLEKMNWYIDDLKWMYPSESGSTRAYAPFMADAAKSCFYSDHYNESPAAFWKFYLETGLQFSKEYINAFLSNTLGFWYPGYYGFSYVMYDNYAPEMFDVPLERKSLLDTTLIRTYYQSMCNSDFWRETPVLRLFFVPGCSLWILLYLVALSLKKKALFTKVMPLFLPLIAQYGIMLLSPMSSFRYSWPFYLMIPVGLIAIWGNLSSEESATMQEV